jgi:hypothetical protein
VVGKILVQREPVIAPLVQIRKGTDINRRYSREGVIDHHAAPFLTGRHHTESGPHTGRVALPALAHKAGIRNISNDGH